MLVDLVLVFLVLPFTIGGKSRMGSRGGKNLLHVKMHMGRSTMMTAGGMIFRDMKAAKFLLTENSYFILGEHQFISIGLLKKYPLMECLPGKS